MPPVSLSARSKGNGVCGQGALQVVEFAGAGGVAYHDGCGRWRQPAVHRPEWAVAAANGNRARFVAHDKRVA